MAVGENTNSGRESDKALAICVKDRTVSAAPTISVNPVTICAGNTATLTASGASTYSWSNGATGASIVFTPTISALYSVTGFLNGCSATGKAFVIVKPVQASKSNSKKV